MNCQVCLKDTDRLTPHYLPTERKTVEICDKCCRKETLELLGLLYVQEWIARYRPTMERIR